MPTRTEQARTEPAASEPAASERAASEPAASERPGPGEAEQAARAARVVVTAEGPVLISGPVDLELPDGTRVSSRRPVTAVCTCRRSRRYPFCDASHRTAPENT